MGASSDELEASITAFSAGKEGDVASSPSPAVKNKRSANRYLVAIVKTLPFAAPPECDELQWALPATSWKHQSTRLQLKKRAILPHRLLHYVQTKDWQASKFFLCVKSPTSHTSCMKQHAICASSDELEASIDPFVLAQECDVAPSPSAP